MGQSTHHEEHVAEGNDEADELAKFGAEGDGAMMAECVLKNVNE